MENEHSGARTWLITGCSSGLGAALANALLAAGDQVAVTARQLESLSRFEGHSRALCLPLDVTQPQQVASAVAATLNRFGRLDVLVNNAGAALFGALEDASESEVAACMTVNFHGPLALMQAAAPILRAQQSGRVINISAAAAIANYPGFAIYGAAKAALEAASESFRLEMAPHGVHVTLVQPGPFRTDFIGRSLTRSARTTPGYEATAGKFGALLDKMHGRQPGDPDKAALAILRMVQEGRHPQRLVLGAYAQKKVRDTAAARLRELDEHAALGAGTEFTA